MSGSELCRLDHCSSSVLESAPMAPSVVPTEPIPHESCCTNIQVDLPSRTIDSPSDEQPKVTFDIELPSILLTPDGNENDRIDASSESLNLTPSMEHNASPRLSYNSLLHWNKSPSKNDLEYLLNKYSELEGKILTVEIPLSQIAVEVGHAKPPQLGLCLAGNRDLNQMSVFVCGIRPGSIVERDGRIELGDQLLEVNDHTLYGLSHLNAAPIIRSIYLDVVQGSNRIFRRTKLGSIRFVIQRYAENLSAMAVTASHFNEMVYSAKSSRRSSVETVFSVLSTPQKSGYDNSKAKRSLEMMELAFGEKRGPLVEQTVFINLLRGSSGFGFAIMEGSPTNEEGIYVKQIIPNGPAALDGRLCPGDQLIRVNKRDATHASYDSVLEWIRSAKQELRLQVKRLGFASQQENQEQVSMSRGQKRFSAPQLLGTLAAVFRGSDTQTRRPRSSHDPRDSLGSGKITLEPVQETEQPRRSHLMHRTLSSRLRRASSPNLRSWRNGANGRSRNVHLLSEASGPDIVTDKRGSVSTLKSTGSALQPTSTEPPEPAEPASTRPIVPGANTVIELELEQGRRLGIGFIGGAETALNVLAVHELYAKGIAVKDGRLRPGDQIIRVSNISLVGLQFVEAISCVHSAYNELLPKAPITPESGTPSETTETPETVPASHVLTLEVRRPETDQSPWYDQEVTVELSKKSGKGLGICIADRCVYSSHTEKQKENGQTSPNNTAPVSKSSYGVIITELIRGSMAATDGRLAVNDQILSVNGEDTAHANSEIVGALLKTASNKIQIRVGRLKNQVNISGTAFYPYLPSS